MTWYSILAQVMYIAATILRISVHHAIEIMPCLPACDALAPSLPEDERIHGKRTSLPAASETRYMARHVEIVPDIS